MKKFLLFLGGGVLLAVIAGAIFIATFKPPKMTDYGVFARLRVFVPEVLTGEGAHIREISKEFDGFTLDLSFPFNKMFGSDSVGVPLRAFSSEKIATATISQFEVPQGSGYYRDFVLNIRPDYGLQAPVFHMDFMKPSPGTPGLCTIDFFNVDKKAICLETFFGDDFEKIKEVYESVSPYQRTVEEGRGKITRYLDEYKTEFRMELIEPGDAAARKAYFETAEKAVRTLLPIYIRRVNACQPVKTFVRKHERRIKGLVRLIYKKDFAVAMGKRIFKKSFKRYWLDGFWAVDMKLPAE